MKPDPRSPRRRLLSALAYPLSMWESKRDPRIRRLSQFRVVVGLFAFAFMRHWPTEWTWPAVWALAVLALALPVSDLFSRVPVAEALDAFRQIAVAAASRGGSPAGADSRSARADFDLP